MSKSSMHYETSNLLMVTCLDIFAAFVFPNSWTSNFQCSTSLLSGTHAYVE